ncbi:MAG TPA: hypothetical protein VGN52_18935 [Burkholderiales bacterium]
MKSFRPWFLALFSLCVALYAGEAAAARSHAAPSASRYTHWLADHRQYPLGSPDFYHQFAEDRDDLSLADASLQFAGGARESTPVTQAGGIWMGLAGDSGSMRFSRADGSHATTQATAPQSGSLSTDIALPVAALGLMLFVARRRTLMH